MASDGWHEVAPCRVQTEAITPTFRGARAEKVRQSSLEIRTCRYLSKNFKFWRTGQESESNIRTKSSSQEKQFSIDSLLGKEILSKHFRNMYSYELCMTFHNMLKTLSAFTECFDRSSRMTGVPPTPVNCSARIRLHITCQDHLKSNHFTDKWVSWIKYYNPRESPYIGPKSN